MMTLKHRVSSLSALLVLVALPLLVPSRAAGAEKTDAHRLVGLLDYVGADYSMAVEDGEVINDFEYREMHTLVADAKALVEDRPRTPDSLHSRLDQLGTLIDRKVPPPKVRKTASEAKAMAVEAFDIALHPRQAPSFERGKRLYRDNCVSCHGERGSADVPGADEMQPPPADFTDPQRRGALSPYRVYNTIRFGIEGTPMQAYKDLSGAEKWDLAFYTMALGHGAVDGPAPADEAPETSVELPSLTRLAKKSDAALVDQLRQAGLSAETAEKWLRYLRAGTPFETNERASSRALQTAQNHLDRARRAWQNGDGRQARSHALAAYLDGFEMVEPKLSTMDPDLVQKTEAAMMALRTGLKNDAPDLEDRFEEAEGLLERSAAVLQSDTGDFWTATTASALIILREGFEIILLITLLLGVLTRMERGEAKKFVHAGWVAALAAGGATWIAAQKLIAISGAGRELIEGIVGLLAAGVLFSVSYWFLQNLHGRKFMRFIKEKLQSKVSGGQLAAIFGLSFLAVYREAFETVLFYQALLNSTQDASQGVLAGMVGGGVVLAGLAYLLLKAGKTLPMRQFFAASGVLLFGLCIVLTGSGLHAFVEAGVVPVLPVPFVTVDFLGIYPELVPLTAQGLLLVAGLIWAGSNLTEAAEEE